MVILLDADGLIKLNRGRVLERVARVFECVITDVVYHEVVTQGKEQQYPDAAEIERIVETSMAVQSTATLEVPDLSLDPGETSVFGLAVQQTGEYIIVSDDRRFLSLLARQGVPFLVPVDLIVTMIQEGYLTEDEARDALEWMRPLIAETAYYRAMQKLESWEDKIR